MVVNIDRDNIVSSQRGTKVNVIVTYSARGTYKTPNILYFIPTFDEKEVLPRLVAKDPVNLKDKVVLSQKYKDFLFTDEVYSADKIFDLGDLANKGEWSEVFVDSEEWEENDDISGGEIATPITSDGWVRVTNLGEPTQDVAEYEVTISPYNNSSSTGKIRNAVIVFEDGDGDMKGLSVRQSNGYLSIWQNYNYIGGLAAVGQNYDYSLKVGDDTIYKGITVPIKPMDKPMEVNVPRLCEDVINTRIFATEEGWVNIDGSVAVDFYHNESFVNTFYFYNDWSSDKLIYNENTILNDPINGHLAYGMRLPLCLYNANNNEHWYVMTDFGGGDVQEELLGIPDYDFNSYTVAILAGLQELVFYNLDDENLRMEYKGGYCGEGYFIYRNRYGAWDVFLIEGNVYENDNLSREQYVANNTDNRKNTWEKTTSKLSISKSYSVSTGWLSDEESRRLVYHLISSPEVYWIPLDGGVNMVSVNITDDSAEYKRFKNGKRLVNYNISFEVSKKERINR